MDKKLEEIIVKSFFTKRLQNRVLFELSSSKKRKDAIGRLCHNYRTTLREEYMIEIPKPNSCPIDIGDLLKNMGLLILVTPYHRTQKSMEKHSLCWTH
ncbi:hypothetical protein [Bacillus toyonensis]|uniref:hypothetical protein n=1 Tax=Bacillus toyonensis TaxID=155322 RepID=UPI00211D8124